MLMVLKSIRVLTPFESYSAHQLGRHIDMDTSKSKDPETDYVQTDLGSKSLISIRHLLVT